MAPSDNPLITMKSLTVRFEPFSKAGRAEHLILMFGDTLPAEKSSALRTAGHCLAKPMIQTALVSDVLHGHLAKLILYSLITKDSVGRKLAIQGMPKLPKI